MKANAIVCQIASPVLREGYSGFTTSVNTRDQPWGAVQCLLFVDLPMFPNLPLHRRHRLPEPLPRRRRVPREVAVRHGIAVAPGRAGALRAAVHAAARPARDRRVAAGGAASRPRAAAADRLLPGGHVRAVTAPDRDPFRDLFRGRA